MNLGPSSESNHVKRIVSYLYFFIACLSCVLGYILVFPLRVTLFQIGRISIHPWQHDMNDNQDEIHYFLQSQIGKISIQPVLYIYNYNKKRLHFYYPLSRSINNIFTPIIIFSLPSNRFKKYIKKFYGANSVTLSLIFE